MEERECWICGRTESKLEETNLSGWLSPPDVDAEICPVCSTLLDYKFAESSDFIRTIVNEEIRSLNLKLEVLEKKK